MGHRSLAMLFGAASLLASQMASALGLGEVNLNSSLNQPLDAEIKILQIRDLTKQEILIGLASRDDFERIGVDRPYFLSDLSFEVDIDNPGGPVVRVKSTKPVREPFLNFIIQAQWPSGKVLREYTLLLDLPVFSDAPAQPVAATQSQNIQVPAAKKPATQAPKSDTRYNPRSSFDEGRASVAESTTASSGQSQSAYAGVDVIGPVKANQTLWEIAAQVRPDRSVSVQQTMLAIQRLNPDAFINNNINLLKRGQILRVPDAAQIKEFSRQEAVRSVAQQNAAWSGSSAAGDVQLSGSKSYSSSTTQSDKTEGRLKLYSPEDASDASSGRTSGSGSSSSEALENELAITQEQLEKTERDNQELRSKLESLEEQIQTMERLVEVSNNDLRAQELAAEKTLRDREAAENAAAANDKSEVASVEPAAPVEEVSPAVEVVEPEPEVVEEATKPEPSKVVLTQRKPEPSIMDMLMDNILFVALGVVALLGAIVLFVRSRSNKDDFEEDDFLEQTTFEAPEANDEDLLSLGDIDSDESELDFEQPEEQPEEQEEVTAEAETGDAAAEADIYIAYGKYDQAEEMLLAALEKEPRNIEARLKLLEVYASQNDAHKFDPHFAVIYAEGNAGFVERGQQLRAGIAGAGEFDADLYVTDVLGETFSDNEEAESTSDDMDFELDLDASSTDVEPEQAADTDDDADLDFNLDMSEESGSEQDSDSFDFDLDLGGLDDEPAAQSDDALEFDLDTADGDESSLDLELEGLVDEASTSIDLEIDDDSSDLGDLEFDLDLGEESAESGEEDEFSLDFDLDDTSESDTTILPAVDDSTEEAGDDSFDLSDEFLSLGSGSDSDEGGSESAEGELIADNLEEDLESIDFDLGIEDFNSEGAEESAAPSEDSAAVEGSLEDDLAALDFDLDSLELDDGNEDKTELSAASDELDLDDLGGDLELTDADTTGAAEELDLGGLDELEDLDLSLEGGEDDLAELDETLALDTEALDVDSLGASADDLDLSELDAELEAHNDQVQEQDAGSLSLEESTPDVSSEDLVEEDLNLEGFDADDLALEDDLSPEAELPQDGGLELGDDLELDVAQEGASPVAPIDEPLEVDEAESDNLGSVEELDGDLDLSALDDELNALTGDLDLDDLEADFSEEALTAEMESEDGGEETDDLLGAQPEEAPSDEEVATLEMEEPVTDFGELDDLGDDLVLDAEPPELAEEPEMGDDTLFTKAISEVPDEDLDFEIPEIDPDSMDDDSDLGFLSDSDETATKLDLARAYIDMGDAEGARDIIDEIMKEGSDLQKEEADKLLARI